jgi:hypothetical protein
LKTVGHVSTAEKYALEIEIFTLSRGLPAQISRSCAQKKAFSAVSTRAVWKDRLFQHNRPKAGVQLDSIILRCPCIMMRAHNRGRAYVQQRRHGQAKPEESQLVREEKT